MESRAFRHAATTLSLAAIAILTFAVFNGTAAPPPMPQQPILQYNGKEEYQAGGKQWVRYKLSVTNKSQYSPDLFKPAPDLPPCGTNKNSSRAWVDIYDGTPPYPRIYGFCALGSPNDLSNLWFAVEKGKQPPPLVYITITDRKLNQKVTSNKVGLPNFNLPEQDVLNKCMDSPDSYYKLPFGDDLAWVLSNGNWDDPKHGHNQGNPNGLQAFAFDFIHPLNGKILAARAGTVYAAEASQTGNSWGTSKVYFFKGTQYLRYDVAADKVDDGYPLSIAGHWSGWPAAWNSGIDAAVNWGNGKVYFFRGSQYLRYDIAADKVDSGFPRSIAGNWPGWPAAWNSGVDEAISWSFGRAYFFKGDQYLLYDMAADKVASAYPRPIAGNWPGFPPAFNSGIGAAVMWDSGYMGVGNYLVIQHNDGTFGVYFHLNKNGIRVKVGDKVARGDWVASSGNTGNSTQPHLHFDVRTGWSLGYPANRIEFMSVKIRFQDQNHTCWIPRVGDMLRSNNGP